MKRYKNLLFSLLICLLVFVGTGCSTCEIDDDFVGHTTLLELSIMGNDLDSVSFEKTFSPELVEVRDGFFEAKASYQHPRDVFFEDLREFTFFFAHTAVGNESSIFTKPVGTTTLIGGDLPNEEGVDYFERVPTDEAGVFNEWRPTDYLGAVEIIGKGRVEMSIVFGEGNEWRDLFAVYQFECSS